MLNALKQVNFYQCKAISLLFLLAFCFILSCGKRKPPLPPKERVSQKAQISGFQRGNFVFLSWKMPARNADDGSLLNIDRVNIYRLAQPLTTPLFLTEEDFSKRSTLISSKIISDDDFGLKTITFQDQLEFAGQTARLIYAIRFVNASGQKADFSNFLLVEPTAKVAKKPESTSAEIIEPEIRISWISPATNIDDSTPVNLLGFNVYRIEKSKEPIKLNEEPISENSFSDSNFNFGNEYRYFVRSVSVGTEGEPVESLGSKIVSVLPKDVFPPSPPDAITIAAAPNNLSIFFATNPEKDIAGYTLYRSIDPQIPLDKWQNLTPELLKANTYQDKSVEPGKTYYYYLTASDLAGNVSRPSEIFSEKAP